MPISEQTYQEARSRIFWGETKEEAMSVLLSSSDCSREQASRILDGFIEERNRSARREAAMKIMTGLGLIALSALLTVGSMKLLVPAYLSNKATMIFLVPGVYGLFAISRGIDLWIKPRFRFSD